MFCDTCSLTFLRSLENSITRVFVCHPVREHDHNQADNGFEQSDRRTEAVLPIQDRGTVHERIDDIAFIVNERIVEVEDLIEAAVQNIAERQRAYNDRNPDMIALIERYGGWIDCGSAGYARQTEIAR